MNNRTVIGLDLAKMTHAVVALDGHGREQWRRTRRRQALLPMLACQPPCLVAMEACSGAHYWAQRLQQYGHEVHLYPPKHIKAYLRGQKNDYNDALAIAEAALHGRLRPVPVKTVDQQDAALVVQQRKQLKEEQVRVGNRIRAILAERGLVLPKGVAALRKGLPALLEDADNGLTPTVRHVLNQIYQRLRALLDDLRWYDHQLEQHAREDDAARRLCEVPGIGPIVASVLEAWMGDGKQFRRGRDASAALGLVPRQHSTGGRQKLGGISKRGDRYTRSQVVNGAQAVLRYAHTKDDALHRWVVRLQSTRGHNKAVIALANKLVRIAWVILARDEHYSPQHA